MFPYATTNQCPWDAWSEAGGCARWRVPLRAEQLVSAQKLCTAEHSKSSSRPAAISGIRDGKTPAAGYVETSYKRGCVLRSSSCYIAACSSIGLNGFCQQVKPRGFDRMGQQAAVVLLVPNVIIVRLTGEDKNLPSFAHRPKRL